MYLIKKAKRIYYDKKTQKWSNKGKTTWYIIKKLTNNQHSYTDIQELTKDIIIIISNLSNDRSKASSETIPAHSAI